MRGAFRSDARCGFVSRNFGKARAIPCLRKSRSFRQNQVRRISDLGPILETLKHGIQGENKHPGNRYGGRSVVTNIIGDGVGFELSESVKKIFKVSGVPITWEEHDLRNLEWNNTAALDAAVESIDRNKVALKGILYTPLGQKGHPSLNLYIRKKLNIFASMSFIKNIEGTRNTRYNGLDITIFRENTEGEYSGLEHSPYPGVIESLKVVSRQHTENLAKLALNYCILNNKKKLTIVHKANIMKESDGLFLQTAQEVAEKYKSYGIKCNAMIVDNASMQMVLNPHQFEVMVCGNLYGSILSNIGAGLIGGPGIVPGSNFGFSHSLFEPGCRHIGRDIAGKNIANPTGFILTALHMLKHIGGMDDHIYRIHNAIQKTFKNHDLLTPDLGGTNTTTGFTNEVLRNMS